MPDWLFCVWNMRPLLPWVDSGQILDKMFFARLLRLAELGPCKCRISQAAIASILAACALPTAAATDCEGARNIRLTHPVQVDPALRTEIQALPALKVLAIDSPPMARYDAARQTYVGIAIDILCFVTDQLGIGFEIAPPEHDDTPFEKMQQVQAGAADLVFPLSDSAERAKLGLFTASAYTSFYAAVARRGSGIVVRTIDDLTAYRVGYVHGFAFEPMLRLHVPAARLLAYEQWWAGNGLSQAVQDGSIDIAIFTQHVFIEKRYRGELFDLEIIHTLYDYPRLYRYYFQQSGAHERLVEAFDLYLNAIDTSASIAEHQDGERDFLDRYITQRDQRTLLLVASAAAVLLAFFTSLALLWHRRLTRLLRERNAFIEHQRHALYEANQKLDTLSRTDPLTDLANRRHFDERADEEYKRHQRNGAPLSLLVIDVDRFKSVNDGYGHATGDTYLRTIANVVARMAGRASDVVSRYGGEEFTCLLPDTPAEAARLIAERIRREVENLHLPNASASPPWVTVSIGVATATGGVPDVQTLYEQADMQLYMAKQSGRNQVSSVVMDI